MFVFILLADAVNAKRWLPTAANKKMYLVEIRWRPGPLIITAAIAP